MNIKNVWNHQLSIQKTKHLSFPSSKMVGCNLDQFGYITEVGEDEHLLNYEKTAGTFVTDDTPLGRVMVA